MAHLIFAPLSMRRTIALALAAVGRHASVQDPLALACNPSSVGPLHRCSYVREHADQCWPEGGLSRYLEIHECFFAPQW